MLNWRDPGNPLSGGAERVSLGYLAALVARGHEVYWFANTFPGAAPRAEYEGVKVVRGGGLGTSFFKAWRWARREARFDLVIDQHHGIPWFAPWWCGTTCVAYIHEVLGPIWHSFYAWPLAWIGRLQERAVLWGYRRVPFWSACPSTESALRRSGVQQVKLVPYGVATEPLPALPPKRIKRPLRLVVVSRLAPNKRIDHAISAVAILRREGMDVRLTVVGTGEMEPALREQVRSDRLDDVVTFTGALPEDEKDALLTDSHLLLHTSVREGWGLNVIEANCLGTPAVVYPVPGLIESTLDGETGLVVAREEPAALADGIKRMRTDRELYRRCREAAWKRGGTFHWDRVLPGACDWLEHLATKGAR